MSYYTDVDPSRIWEVFKARLTDIPLESNRARIQQYLAERRATGRLRPSTMGIEVDELRRLGLWLKDRRLEDLGRQGIVDFFGTTVHLKPRTRGKTYQAVRSFYRWHHGLEKDEAPPEFLRFRLEKARKMRLDAKDLVEPEEFAAMLRFCRNSQERALMWVLYEVGPRAREILFSNLSGLRKDKFGFIVQLPNDGPGLKTGTRPLRLVRAAQALQEWLNEHRLRTKGDAPIFYGLSNRAPYQRMGYQTLYALVKRVAREANISKRVWPHLLRHTSATNAARRGLGESVLKKHYGWSDESTMPAVYVHLAEEDVDEQILRSYNLLPAAKQKGDAVRPITCPKCAKENPAQVQFCQGCDLPLTPEAEKVLADRQKTDTQEVLARMLAGTMTEEIARQVHVAFQKMLGGVAPQST